MPPDFLRLYSRQEYMTPAAAETVAMIAETMRPTESTALLDVACGKGEAATTLAGRFGCRVVAVDLFDPFIHYAASKAWLQNLGDLVTVARADGKRLPVRDGAFDAAYCIGAPSIVGLGACLREMARSVKPGGCVAASDVAWRVKPDSPLGPEWGWVAHAAPRHSLGEYAAAFESAGLRVERTHVHSRTAWDDYWRPMSEVIREARASGDTAFADENDHPLAIERRAVETFLDYATIIARKPWGSSCSE